MKEHPEFCTCMACVITNQPYPAPNIDAQRQAEGINKPAPFPGQAKILNPGEQRLREVLIAQHRGMQNCAPGSPLYDKVMGTNTCLTEEPPAHKDESFYHLTQPDAFKAGQRSGIHITVMLALKLSFRIVLVVSLAIGVLAVFS